MKIEIVRRDISIGNLPAGSLFLYDGTVALKSEHRTDSGACKCYIVGTGEMFWGGTGTAKELNKIFVTPILLTNG